MRMTWSYTESTAECGSPITRWATSRFTRASRPSVRIRPSLLRATQSISAITRAWLCRANRSTRGAPASTAAESEGTCGSCWVRPPESFKECWIRPTVCENKRHGASRSPPSVDLPLKSRRRATVIGPLYLHVLHNCSTGRKLMRARAFSWPTSSPPRRCDAASRWVCVGAGLRVPRSWCPTGSATSSTINAHHALPTSTRTAPDPAEQTAPRSKTPRAYDEHSHFSTCKWKILGSLGEPGWCLTSALGRVFGGRRKSYSLVTLSISQQRTPSRNHSRLFGHPWALVRALGGRGSDPA